MRRFARGLAAAAIGSLAVAACQLAPAATDGTGASIRPDASGAQASAPGESAAPGDGIDLPEDFPIGAGDYVLLDPLAGLATLGGHGSTLTETFDGTVRGAPAAWSRTVTFVEATSPDARQVTVVRSGADPASPTGESSEPTTIIEAAGLHHELGADGTCSTSYVDPRAPLLDPAASLGPLVGASAAGSELLQGVPTTIYSIDRGALGIMAEVEVAGRVWIATTGEYIVRYEVEVSGGPAYFGEGITGTTTSRYALTDSAAAIPVPPGCQSLAISISLPVDATDVTDAPGYLGYRTGASVAEAADLVKATALIAHWTPVGTPVIDETAAHLEYEVEGSHVDIFITEAEEGSDVQMVAGLTAT